MTLSFRLRRSNTSYAREARGDAFAHLGIPCRKLCRLVRAHLVAGTVKGKRTSPRCRLHITRNAIADAAKGQRQMVAAVIGIIFAQDSAEAARVRRRVATDQLLARSPNSNGPCEKPSTTCWPISTSRANTEPNCTVPIPLSGELKRRADVIGVIPNEPAIVRLVSSAAARAERLVYPAAIRHSGNAGHHWRRSPYQATDDRHLTEQFPTIPAGPRLLFLHHVLGQDSPEAEFPANRYGARLVNCRRSATPTPHRPTPAMVGESTCPTECNT